MNMDASNGWPLDKRPFAVVGGYGRTRPLFGGEKALDRLIAGFDAAMFGQTADEPEGSRAGEVGWRVPVIRQYEIRDDEGAARGSTASAHQGRTALEQGDSPLIAMREAQGTTPDSKSRHLSSGRRGRRTRACLPPLRRPSVVNKCGRSW